MGKVIALFIDGTLNEGEKRKTHEETNVWRLFKGASAQSSAMQLVRYIRGVGVPARKASRMLTQKGAALTPRKFTKLSLAVPARSAGVH